MTNRYRTSILLGTVSLMGLFSACDMMEGLYDDTLDSVAEEAQGPDNGSQAVAGTSQYYVNATSYTQWVYINLHTDPVTITTSTINPDDGTETGAPAEWDFAHHRYDIKTHGAQVLMTPYHSMDELAAGGIPAEGTWASDTYSDESITVDMSHMLEGYLIYAPGYKNSEAGRWLDVDTSTMPPIYTMHDNVMLYRLADGTCAAIQLVNFMSTDRYQTKGWMTVNYRYPIL